MKLNDILLENPVGQRVTPAAPTPAPVKPGTIRFGVVYSPREAVTGQNINALEKSIAYIVKQGKGVFVTRKDAKNGKSRTLIFHFSDEAAVKSVAKYLTDYKDKYGVMKMKAIRTGAAKSQVKPQASSR